ncbi:RNA pyrophosphohydrolase [Agrobacterium sp. rho-13.3]|uniref:RNA pyrophosphohydrolase n=1 Tax=Agrobacterium sp. rho-13.3 TaxID=3072980 RepID=UPI002A0C3F47|nr:RNA pyrophosphohydrolase [Agrobacterium sp. rho-13.3]MDX8310662.1 RNA pyrophosphohydrolase [Agrobacterium sp. rho-13.3]
MTIKADDLPYRPCVGIMVLNAQGLVWAGRRISAENSEFDGSPQLWQMPQGGIDKGENPLPAAIRELYEETGMKTVTLLAEAPEWINYDLPPQLIGIGLRGKYRGQTQRWFAFRFDGEESEIQINPPPTGHTAEFDEWGWKSMESLPDLIVPFKRGVYEQVVAQFRHLAGE